MRKIVLERETEKKQKEKRNHQCKQYTQCIYLPLTFVRMCRCCAGRVRGAQGTQCTPKIVPDKYGRHNLSTVSHASTICKICCGLSSISSFIIAFTARIPPSFRSLAHCIDASTFSSQTRQASSAACIIKKKRKQDIYISTGDRPFRFFWTRPRCTQNGILHVGSIKNPKASRCSCRHRSNVNERIQRHQRMARHHNGNKHKPSHHLTQHTGHAF